MKKRLLIAMIVGFAFTPAAFAEGFCSYDHSYSQSECAPGAWVDGGSGSADLTVQPGSTNFTCLVGGAAEADGLSKGGTSYQIGGGGGGGLGPLSGPAGY